MAKITPEMKGHGVPTPEEAKSKETEEIMPKMAVLLKDDINKIVTAQSLRDHILEKFDETMKLLKEFNDNPHDPALRDQINDNSIHMHWLPQHFKDELKVDPSIRKEIAGKLAELNKAIEITGSDDNTGLGSYTVDISHLAKEPVKGHLQDIFNGVSTTENALRSHSDIISGPIAQAFNNMSLADSDRVYEFFNRMFEFKRNMRGSTQNTTVEQEADSSFATSDKATVLGTPAPTESSAWPEPTGWPAPTMRTPKEEAASGLAYTGHILHLKDDIKKAEKDGVPTEQTRVMYEHLADMQAYVLSIDISKYNRDLASKSGGVMTKDEETSIVAQSKRIENIYSETLGNYKKAESIYEEKLNELVNGIKQELKDSFISSDPQVAELNGNITRLVSKRQVIENLKS